MAGFPSSLGGAGGDVFGSYDAFDPETAPVPGSFLDGHDVLVGTDHLAFHRLTRQVFEERGVYDMTFGYNLARLNLDGRHPDAGYRYAVEDPDADDAVANPAADGPGDPDIDDGPGDSAVDDATGTDADGATDLAVLRAEFTPTTAFCPQSDTLTKASFRAWNGLRGRHEYDLVRVRVAGMHQQADAINDALADLEARFLETGDVERLRDCVGRRDGAGAGPDGSDGPRGGRGPAESGGGYDSPF